MPSPRAAANNGKGPPALRLDPRTTSPVLREMIEDLVLLPEDPSRGAFEALAPRLIGTAGDGKDLERSLRCLDWLVRTYTAEWVDLAGLLGEARKLRKLSAVINGINADAANALLLKVLEVVQSDAARASEQLRAPLEGLVSSEEVGTAWNTTVDMIEAVVKDAPVRSLAAASVRAARSHSSDLATRSGWNVAVSVADMAAQSAGWRKGEPLISEAVKLASQGEDWRGHAAEAKESVAEIVEPTVHRLSQSYLQLIESLIRPG